MYQDIGRGKCFAHVGEIVPMIRLIETEMSKTAQYMKDVDYDPALIWAPSTLKIHYEPLGVSLIISSWNYPILTLIKPLVCAMMAGNCAIVKPSEMAPATAAVFQKLFDNFLDSSCFRLCQGGVDVAIKLTSLRFDLICFTGSTEKGKLVSQAAAKNLVPVIMELGGKCPMIVDETADLGHAAMKICSGKFQNAGQTCIGVDYVLVPKKLMERLLKSLISAADQMFDVHKKKDYCDNVGKLINGDTVKRLKGLIESAGGEIVLGGPEYCDAENRYISPTIIKDPKLDSELMQGEIFGPILPVISYENFDEVVELINSKEKPLAIYFSGSTSSPKVDILK